MVKIAREMGGDGEVHVVTTVLVAEVEKPLEMTGQRAGHPGCGASSMWPIRPPAGVRLIVERKTMGQASKSRE